MARQRKTALLFAALTILAAALPPLLSGATTPQTAEAAATGCNGITLAIPSSTVRRGGRVLVEGRTCGDTSSSAGRDTVQLRIKRGERWAMLARAILATDGRFSACVRINVLSRTRVARLRAVTSSGATRNTSVRVARNGASGCSKPAKSQPALSVLREDPCSDPDPIPLWNQIDAQNSSRHQQFANGGPDGGPFRRMGVQDGDNVSGERAELGYNSRVSGLGAPWGTFFLYNDGDRRITEFSMRLPSDFPISENRWQVVMQMKQTGPSANSGGTPVLALEARGNRWVLTQSDSAGASSDTHELWSTKATVGVWTSIRLDVTYSPNPSAGKVQIAVGGASSPTFTTYTQKRELSPSGPGLNPGDAISSHLRMGVYHDPSLPGTHVDFADVRVLG